MITEEKLPAIFTDINSVLKTVSIAIDTIIKKDDVEITRSRHRCAFVPGQIEEVKAYTGLSDESPEIIYLESIWTPEVIKAYNELIAAQAEE
jgi:hypothetical protein